MRVRREGRWTTHDLIMSSPRFVEICVVCDLFNRRIQKFSSRGEFITKWNIQGSEVRWPALPIGVAVDSSGNVYVSEAYNFRIQKFISTGTFITKWGSKGDVDGRFNFPKGIAVDSSGNVHVSDSGNHRIQVFSPI